MGTRADFYVGRGPDAEWLGSVGWDGYPDGFDAELFQAPDEEAWRAAVAATLEARDDGTTPEEGWPWPWKTSHTTDFTYAFDAGKVHASQFGREWFDPTDPEALEEDRDKLPEDAFPTFGTENFAHPGTKRSGAILVTDEGVVSDADG